VSQTVDIRSRKSSTSSGDSQNGGRVPPHNLQAEESLLGAMLLSQEAIVPAVEACSANDFYKPAHRHIFEAIVTLWGRGEPADPVTVADELNRAELLEAIGGASTLVSLQANTPATSNAGRYARIVEEHALLRKLISAAGEIAEMGYSVPEDVVSTVDHAESIMFDVAQRRVSDTMAPIRELLVQSLDRLESLYDKGEAITGVPTGFVDLDERLSGLQQSALLIVGARPAMGKCVAWDTPIVDPTTGAIYTAAELHKRGKSGEIVDVFSLDGSHQLQTAQPSAFVDDGIKPVFSVRTRLGRHVRTTLSHPFLTPNGWMPLGKLSVGDSVAVPRRLDVFGIEPQPESELALLAYLLSSSADLSGHPSFETDCEVVAEDSAAHGCRLGARAIRSQHSSDTTSVVFTGRNDLVNPVTELLRRHGLMTPKPSERELPAVIAGLPKEQLSYFLKRLLSCGGDVVADVELGTYFRWSTPSKFIGSQVQHFLLRFGINAELRESNHRWLLSIEAGEQVRLFTREVGLVNAQAAEALANSAELATVATQNVLVGAGGPSDGTSETPTLWESAAAYLSDSVSGPDLPPGADVAWDPIVSIDYDGDEQVYDLTVPVHHNFVAGDVVVHNTAFALNIASHAALTGTKVLYFSLEMSHLEITQRLLCAEARVDASRLRNGRLLDTDWPKINHAIGRLGEAPIYIDDNPNLTIMDIRAKARRLKAGGDGLGLVIIDYLQLMSGRSNAENRQVEVSEMSRGLKILARELNVPVIALSQLSRNLEMRADKRPVLADLRESGCLVASTRITRADTGEDVTIGELYESGERDIPIWTLDDRWKLSVGNLTHAFSSGVKEVFRMKLASGREIEATGNHPFRTVQAWTALEDLTVGTRIAVSRRIPEPQQVQRASDDEVVLAAHLLGSAFSADGQQLRYHSADVANAHAVLDAVASFNVEPVVVDRSQGRDIYFPFVDGTGGDFGDWLVSREIAGSEMPDGLPRFVFALPDFQLRLFFRHFFAEVGVVDCGSQTIDAAVVSPQMASDVQALLRRLEIDSSTSASSASSGSRVGIDEPESVGMFIDGVGIYGAAGARLFELRTALVASSSREQVPFDVLDVVRAAGSGSGVSYSVVREALGKRGSRSPVERLSELGDVFQNKELRQIAEADVVWDQVIEITSIGNQQVFDATVPGTHNFVANGIVTHNSLEQDADVVMFLYRDEVYNAESPDKGTAEVLVSKHRNGPVGTTQLAFIDRYTRFANMARV
jgi:replicative DNA helicase